MGKKLYVGNLPFNTTDEALQEIFAQAGSVQSAKVITDRDTGRSKGFGFVEMSSDQEATDAIQWRESTHQHKIHAFIAVCLFHHQQIGRHLHHAQ